MELLICCKDSPQKLTNLIGGGLVDKVVDTAVKYFPPDVSPEQKQQFALECRQLELKYAQQQQHLINQAEALLTQRISQLEVPPKTS
ncbi:hypothetical protein [Zooshikella ganghwensis]|uniref:hypothetical protein n=1 Tax=Zooshikella ganghwensis TaxID=202772 RepID=UPI001E364CFA|nr:hypothetical protein [Zooshikella ganghwensis]